MNKGFVSLNFPLAKGTVYAIGFIDWPKFMEGVFQLAS